MLTRLLCFYSKSPRSFSVKGAYTNIKEAKETVTDAVNSSARYQDVVAALSVIVVEFVRS